MRVQTSPGILFLYCGMLVCWFHVTAADLGAADNRPNILLAISDDQSFPHTSFAEYPAIKTPAFDRIARRGLYFENGICSSPGCSPSRASLLTGQYPWQIEHAGTHASSFPAQYPVYPELLEQSGYFVGYTGKGWGPGNWKVSGRDRNPAGLAFNARELDERPASGISKRDYTANFRDFLKSRPKDRPFCFWYGAHEPHRGFEKGSGLDAGKKLEDAPPPKFLPDVPEVRSELLDYCLEIEHFDHHLQRMLDLLDEMEELDNTIIVVTGDNGMAFPRAKANCYEYGIHVPLAISWADGIKKPGRVITDPVSFVDLAPTFLEVAGLKPDPQMVGKSLTNIFGTEESGKVDVNRLEVFSARERHSSSRYRNLAYPQRALREQQYLLIHNFRPDRWPAGAPQKYDNEGNLEPMHEAYHDIDACPTLTYLVEHREDSDVSVYFHAAVDKRPEFELFDIQKDPDCMRNLSGDPDYAEVEENLKERLQSFLEKTKDPRQLDGGDIFETYKRYSPIRQFPDPNES